MLQYAYICLRTPHPPLFYYLSIAVFNDYYSELTPYTALENSYRVSVYDVYQSKAMLINDNGYNCHITVVELV